MNKILGYSAFFVIGGCLGAKADVSLRLVQTIPLENVEGRIDHMAADVEGKRLFVAALGNHTVEVINLSLGERVQELANLNEPQGVCYAPELKRLFVADRADGKLTIFEGQPFSRVKEIDLQDDADNLRYEPAAQIVYAGYADGALGMISPQSGDLIASIALSGHPESFQLEKAGPRIFVNVPGGRVAVVNRQTRRLEATWTPGFLLKANYPMALDETHHRLFVGYRLPSCLVVINTEAGAVVSRLESASDADDVYYDSSRQRIYVSGGEGVITVLAALDPDHYRLLERIHTAPGARTSLFVPELNRLYVAIPHRGGQPAAIRVYQAQ